MYRYDCQNDKKILWPLAAAIREIAADPENNEKKIERWKRHNSLRGR